MATVSDAGQRPVMLRLATSGGDAEGASAPGRDPAFHLGRLRPARRAVAQAQALTAAQCAGPEGQVVRTKLSG